METTIANPAVIDCMGTAVRRGFDAPFATTGAELDLLLFVQPKCCLRQPWPACFGLRHCMITVFFRDPEADRSQRG
jgi:hypothetical protein